MGPGGGHAPRATSADTLRVLTWNLGPHGHLRAPDVRAALDAAPGADRLDALLLTETHMDDQAPARAAFAAALGPAWACFWSGVPPGRTARAARGVCLAVHRRCAARFGACEEVPVPAALGGSVAAVGLGPPGAPDRLLLVGAYIPDSSAHRAGRTATCDLVSQIEAIEGLGAVLRDLSPAFPHLLIGGDLNFAENPLDRPMSALSAADVAATAAWDGAGLGALVEDPYRTLQPAGTATTCLHSVHGNLHRLDRFYVRRGHADRCTVDHQPLTVTHGDHMAVRLDYRGASQRSPRPWHGAKMDKADLTALRDPDFCEWLKEATEAAPAAAADLLAWWPGFKAALVERSRAIGRERRGARREALRALDQEAAAALEAVAAAGPRPPPAAVARWTAAQAHIHDSWATCEAATVLARRRDRLPLNETPSPAVTRALQPRAAAPAIHRLATAPGRPPLVAPQRMASAMARFTEAIYRPPPVREDALSEMEALVAARAPGPAAFGSLVDREVPEMEMNEILQSVLHRGRATGPDGVAAEVYIDHIDIFTPLLARLFTAINLAGQPPPGFADGVIVYLPKGTPGPEAPDPTPGDFRPITLLNADYKAYTSVLAQRLGPMLKAVVPPGQSAFLDGRRITDCTLTTRAVHDLLTQRGAAALAVDLDIAKAYDQVSRTALRRLWVALGGARATFWLDTILVNTSSRAYVNGYLSAPFQLHAGVRQGCPASPGLYLIIALGLLRLLESRGLGIPTYGQGADLHTAVAAQYADDTTAYTTPQALPRLFEAVERYRQASGQSLNWGKSRLVPIGAWGGQPPPPALSEPTAITVGGELVRLPGLPARALEDWAPLSAHVLASGPGGRGRPDVWAACEARSLAVMSRIRGAPQLSVLGRAAATGAYAYAATTYHLQLMTPDPDSLQAWQQHGTNVVNGLPALARGGAAKAGFSACRHAVLTGPLREGGFGLQPLQHHMRARQASFGIALLKGEAEWARIYTEALAATEVFKYPAFHRLMLAAKPEHRPWAPDDVPNIAFALDALHDGVDLDLDPAALPAVGPWCAAAPIWHNPLVADADGQPWCLPPPPAPRGGTGSWRPPGAYARARLGPRGRGRGRGRGVRAARGRARARAPAGRGGPRAAALAKPPGGLDPRLLRLDTVGHVVLLERCLTAAPARAATVPARWVARPFRGPRGVDPGAPPPFADPAGLLAETRRLRAAIPPAWYEAAAAAIDDPGQPHPLELARLDPAVVDRLLRAVRWSAPGSRRRLALEDATVRLFTRLLGDTDRPAKAAKLAKFVARAHGREPGAAQPDPAGAAPAFAVLRRMAGLPCSNHFKEAFWLLAYNGVNVASRRGPGATAGCTCGAPGVQDLGHAFWDCPVAQDVRGLLEGPLRACGVTAEGTALERPHVWLARAPEGVAAWVWDLAVLVATHAMDQGRRELARQTPEGADPHRLPAARLRAARAFWAGFQQLATTVRVTADMAAPLAVAAGAARATGRGMPFLKPHPADPTRVVVGILGPHPLAPAGGAPPL